MKSTNFTNWMQQKGFSSKYHKDMNNRIVVFMNWLSKESFNVEELRYTKLLDYIRYLQEQGSSKRSINIVLLAIDHYYQYLQYDNPSKNLSNVARGVRLLGVKHKTPLLLEKEVLDTIYQEYRDPNTRSYYRYSNKLILGLIIYQGLEISEIFQLKLDDLDLQNGYLYIAAGTKLKNSRKITLVAHQVLPLQNYITRYRCNSKHPQHKKTVTTSQKLFSPNCDHPERFEGQLKILRKTIREQHPDINIRNLKQLRQSRIGIWIKEYGLRKAQYLCGYKNISNVERYKEKDLQDLTKQIEMFHPLK